jgi:hypothetical protein
VNPRFSVAALALCALAVGALSTGCAGPVMTSSTSYTVSGTIATLLVKTSDGSIGVKPTDRNSIQVTETYRYTGNKPSARHSTEGGVLSLIASGCGDQVPGSACSVSYTVEVPRATALQLTSDAADITVSNMAGSIDAASDGGTVTAYDVASAHAVLSSDGGSVDARFNVAPSSVDARSDGGDVQLTLPNAVYAVDASSDGGSSQVSVGTASASPRRITVRSDGGNISILPGG